MDKELDASGMYLMPGFVDMHGHIGGEAQGVPAEYVLNYGWVMGLLPFEIHLLEMD